MQGKPVAEQEIGRQLLYETASYADTSICRRKFLLHYFGEDYKQSNCGQCDNCLNPKIKVEAKEQLITVLEAIKVLKEKHKTDYIINFLTGHETSEIETFGHDKLEEFGSGDDEDAILWDTVIRYALIEHYLSKDIDIMATKDNKEREDFFKETRFF